MVPQRKRGPVPTGKETQVQVRVHDPLLSALDALAADHQRAKGYLPAASEQP